jgi:large subunit ribosomal protein L22
MENEAVLKYLRMSPRKVRLVANTVKGMNVNDAIENLRHSQKAAAKPLRKLIRSAEANLIAIEGSSAVHDTDLYVSEIQVGEGPTLKRIRPRAMGRAFLIRKRTSHVFVKIKSRDIEGE